MASGSPPPSTSSSPRTIAFRTTGWADAILPRLDEGWDAIGSRLAAGVTTDARSQAAFLLGYGEWMAPLETGPTRVLPGHNVVLRRRLLLELGDELEDLLLVGAFLVRRLRPGRRMLVVAEAGMTHYDVTAFRRQLVVFQTVGRSFGAMRTRRAPTPRARRLRSRVPLPRGRTLETCTRPVPARGAVERHASHVSCSRRALRRRLGRRRGARSAPRAAACRVGRMAERDEAGHVEQRRAEGVVSTRHG